MRRLVAYAVLAVSMLPPLTAPGRAVALTEVRISHVTCRGLRATQTGLPPGTTFEVKVINPDTVTTLKTVRVSSDSKGRLDARIAVSLRGLRRVLVEVERTGKAEAEYGEVGMDLRLPCTPSTRSSSSGPTPTRTELQRPATTSETSARRSVPNGSWVPAIAAGAVLLVVLVAVLRSAGHS